MHIYNYRSHFILFRNIPNKVRIVDLYKNKAAGKAIVHENKSKVSYLMELSVVPPPIYDSLSYMSALLKSKLKLWY